MRNAGGRLYISTRRLPRRIRHVNLRSIPSHARPFSLFLPFSLQITFIPILFLFSFVNRGTQSSLPSNGLSNRINSLKHSSSDDFNLWNRCLGHVCHVSSCLFTRALFIIFSPAHQAQCHHALHTHDSLTLLFFRCVSRTATLLSVSGCVRLGSAISCNKQPSSVVTSASICKGTCFVV